MSKPWLAAHWAKRLLREPPTPAAVPLVDVLTAPEATLVDLVLGIPGAASRVLGPHGLLELGRLSPHAITQRTELGLHDAQRRDADQGRPPPLRISSYRWQRHPITVVAVHGSGRAHIPLQSRCLAPDLATRSFTTQLTKATDNDFHTTGSPRR
ncbi:hypothetical protein WMF26_00690 [Sorangium sp. So ce185]|uniref:hypothetical protein n=1 Tax=Sorangium sp. So ce185 TaxID=3133287 RepID=UPI003F6389DC